MLPVFPKFKKLKISDKNAIDSYTQKFPAYSDFNFASLWVWNKEDKIEIARLNNNLVIKFQDYLTHEYFYSFIGNSDVVSTIEVILSLAKKRGLNQKLKLVPGSNFDKNSLFAARKKFNIFEDKDNNDYIFDVRKIASMKGRALHQKRKLLHHFTKNYEYGVKVRALDFEDQRNVLELFSIWRKLRGKKIKETQNELTAIKRLFIDPKSLDLKIAYATNHKGIVGYTIFEVNKKYAVSSFQKADPSYKGGTELLYFIMAKYLKMKGCKYINAEQDLGVPGLRRAKLDYNPTYLRKYTISRRNRR